MKSFYRFRFKNLLVLIATLVAFNAGCTNKNAPLTVGSKPPDLKISTLKGEATSLDQYKGSVVLLNFWASWCGPCVSELPELQKLYSKLKDRGFTVVAVGIDDEPANLEQFVSTLQLSFPVVVDRGDAKADYKLTGVPETMLLDREGHLMLMLDPESGQATSRILGPREWGSPAVVNRIASLLAK